MSFGFEIQLENGKVFNFNTTGGAVLIDAFTVVTLTSGSREYPDFAGFTLTVNEVAYTTPGWECSTVTIDYSLGYPVLYYEPPPVASTFAPQAAVVVTYILVFAQ
jgi:hypothetical protein